MFFFRIPMFNFCTLWTQQQQLLHEDCRLRRLKTYIRASLSQRKLNRLMILSLNADEVDAMNTNAIVNKFITRGDRKRRNYFALLWLWVSVIDANNFCWSCVIFKSFQDEILHQEPPFSLPKCAKTHLRQSREAKNFPEVIPRIPASRGGKGEGEGITPYQSQFASGALE